MSILSNCSSKQINPIPTEDFSISKANNSDSSNIRTNIINTRNLMQKNFREFNYTLLNISSDEDLKQFSGTGTETDPYLIEDITSLGYDFVRITNVTKNFIIQNCQFNITENAISIYDIASNIAEIQNCKFYLPFSSYSYSDGFVRITLLFRPSGIYLSNITGLKTKNNQFLACNGGVSIYDCSMIELTDNYFYNLSFGIIISKSNSSQIRNNLFYNNVGISVEYCNHLTITGNEFFESGIQFSYHRSAGYGFESFILEFIPYNNPQWFDDHVIEENYVNDRKLGFFYNLSFDGGFDFSKFGQLLLINCSNLCINEADFSDTNLGLFLANCFDCIVSDCIFNNHIISGVYLLESSRIIIQNSKLCNLSNPFKGLISGKADEIKIYNNIIESSIFAITLNGKNNQIESNTLFDFRYGLNLRGSYFRIKNNKFNSQKEFALPLYLSSLYHSDLNNNKIHSCYRGIYASESYNLTFTGNLIENCNYTGIEFSSSHECKITFNTISECKGFGFDLYSSMYNSIHHNRFIRNNFNRTKTSNSGQVFFSQVLDDEASRNDWYDKNTKKGNYWSDNKRPGPYPILSHTYLIGYHYYYDFYPLAKNLKTTMKVQIAWSSTLGGIIFLVSTFVIYRFLKKRKV